jgi:hypothetical protein
MQIVYVQYLFDFEGILGGIKTEKFFELRINGFHIPSNSIVGSMRVVKCERLE